MQLETLDHVGLAVSDVDRSIAFYSQALGLTRVHEHAWGTYPAALVAADGAGVALFPARGAAIERATFDSLPHVAFGASAEAYAQARRELADSGIEFSESDHRVARSLYFLDPDEHLIEITTYEVR